LIYVVKLNNLEIIEHALSNRLSPFKMR